MTTLELSDLGLSNLDTEQESQENYPDEVLESAWNPVLVEIHNLLASPPEPSKTDSNLVDSVPLRHHQ